MGSYEHMMDDGYTGLGYKLPINDSNKGKSHLIVSMNVRSLNANNAKLVNFINECMPSIICLQEVWTHDLSLNDYDVISVSRKTRKGGGIGFVVRSR